MKPYPDNFKLRPYQKAGVRFLLKHQRAILGDDPGLGKTIQTIVANNVLYAKAGKKITTVVVCPACVCENWRREWVKWDIHNRDVLVIRGKKGAEDYTGQKVLICSYASIKNLLEVVPSEILLVGDEFHYTKSWRAKRTNYFHTALLPRSRAFAGLTGTPLDNEIPDLHSLYSACLPGKIPPFKKFCNTFSTPTWNGFATVYRGVRNEAKLKKLSSRFILRRLKSEVLPELPDKIFKKHYVDVPKKVADRSKEYTDLALQVLGLTGGSKVMVSEGAEPPDPAYATVRKALGLEKVKGCLEYYKMLLEGGEKPIVIGAYHREVCEQLQEGLEKEGIKSMMAYGGHSHTHKQKLIDRFQAGKLDACVLNISSMGIGINLHAACNICLAEYVSVPSKVVQFIDRVHRIGQTRGVVVHVAQAKGSLDTAIWNSYRQKMKMVQKVFD